MHSRFIILSLFAGFMLLVVFPTQAQTEERCFAETGYCISGRIREFWERNGALPTFGLPITPQREEMIEGKTVLVQWFERNRLELHPENQRPFDVLLGRLGVDMLERQGRNWQDFPKAAEPQSGCRFFPETGHNVCNEILTAWQVEGVDVNQDGISGNGETENLALFGLPLSDEITETLRDGQVYTVQYFERARFERHPENAPPYNVLLGLLGRELLGETPPSGGEATPTVQPTSSSVLPGGEATPTVQPTSPPVLPAPSFDNCRSEPNADRAPNYPVKIIDVDKRSEVVRLQNVSSDAVVLDGWHMCSMTGNQEHTGIGGVLAPSEAKDFPYNGPGNIWNNNEQDDGALYNTEGQLVSYWYNR